MPQVSILRPGFVPQIFVSSIPPTNSTWPPPRPPLSNAFPSTSIPPRAIAAARAHRLSYGDSDGATASSQAQFSRPEGSLAARSFGNVVHTALETLADRIAADSSPGALLAELPTWTPRLAALLRADGLAHATVNRLAREARTALEDTLRDPDGLWLLAPHAAAANEFALPPGPSLITRTVNPPFAPLLRPSIDRIFRAGAEPHSPGEDFLWIVDYKTTAPHSSCQPRRLPLRPTRRLCAPVGDLRPHPHPAPAPRGRPAPKEVRLALYYPALPRLLWWPLAAPTRASHLTIQSV